MTQEATTRAFEVECYCGSLRGEVPGWMPIEAVHAALVRQGFVLARGGYCCEDCAWPDADEEYQRAIDDAAESAWEAGR